MATGAQFSRAKTWNDEKLTDTDLNAEFDNILNNLDAAGLGSGDTTSANSITQQDPGTYASPNVAATLQDSIEHLRYVLGQIIGGDNSNWLDSPATTIATLAGASEGVAFGLEFEGSNAGASSATNVLAALINKGAIINSSSLSSADVTTSDFDFSNFKFGSCSYILGSGNILAFPGTSADPSKGTISAWFRNLAAGDYIAYNPKLGIELYCDSISGNLTTKITEATASSESAKTSVSVAGSSSRTGDTTFRNAIVTYRLNDEAGASTDSLALYFSGSAEGTALSSQDIDINPGDGGIWFIGAKKNEPSFDHSYAANGLPSNHSDAWDSQGTPGATAANGVLNISTSATTGYYDRTTNDEYVDLTQQTVTFKARINSTDNKDITNTVCGLRIVDTSIDRGATINIQPNACHLFWGYDSDRHKISIQGDFTQFHTFTLTSTGTETADTDCTMKLYIDGMLVYSGTNDFTDNEASDNLQFGVITSSTTDLDLEYFYICETDAQAPIAASSQGNIDSFGIARDLASSVVISSLQTSKFTDVFADNPRYGPYLPQPRRFDMSTSASVTISSTAYSDVGELVYYVPGDGVTEFDFFLATAVRGTAGDEHFVTIDIDNDINGETASLSSITVPYAVKEAAGANLESTVPVMRSETLSTGLHEIRAQAAASANSVVIDRPHAQFNVSIRKEKRIG